MKTVKEYKPLQNISISVQEMPDMVISDWIAKWREKKKKISVRVGEHETFQTFGGPKLLHWNKKLYFKFFKPVD